MTLGLPSLAARMLSGLLASAITQPLDQAPLRCSSTGVPAEGCKTPQLPPPRSGGFRCQRWQTPSLLYTRGLLAFGTLFPPFQGGCFRWSIQSRWDDPSEPAVQAGLPAAQDPFSPAHGGIGCLVPLHLATSAARRWCSELTKTPIARRRNRRCRPVGPAGRLHASCMASAAKTDSPSPW